VGRKALTFKLFSPRIPDPLLKCLPLFSFSPAVIPPVSTALPICHPASEWRESSGISGEKRRKGGSKENKEGKRRGAKRAKRERKSRENKEAEERGRREERIKEDKKEEKRETARARVRLRMTKNGCQDPDCLPDEKRQSFKQELLSATIEFILLSKERTGNVC